MHSVRADYPVEWPFANIYTLADLHVGDEHASMEAISKRIGQIKEDPYGLCICNGDIMNTALKTSVSDIYSEQLSPMQQMQTAVDLLAPIKDKIIAVTTGNHESRIYRTDGIDIMRLVCRELKIEDKYHPDGVLVFLRFGERQAQTLHKKDNRNPRQWYSVYATHGSGGGRKEGAKAIRLADMAAIVDADIYVHSHTHLPMIMKQAFYRADSSNCCAKRVEKLFVNTAAALEYGGYGQAQEFKPASLSNPVIHLEAKTKCARATL